MNTHMYQSSFLDPIPDDLYNAFVIIAERGTCYIAEDIARN